MIASYTFEGARMTHPTPTPLTLIENGTGRPVLVLHGGGGPASVAVIAQRLSATTHTIVPVHPGWDGTDRPSHLRRAGDYAAAYLQHLHRAELSDVLVVGSSWGGWVGLEMGLQDEAGLLSGLVLIDSVGITVDDEPVADFFALDAGRLPSTSSTTRSGSTRTLRPSQQPSPSGSSRTWPRCAPLQVRPPCRIQHSWRGSVGSP
jgi:pimeloyl-ACP methyl ester carboxylesterase